MFIISRKKEKTETKNKDINVKIYIFYNLQFLYDIQKKKKIVYIIVF